MSPTPENEFDSWIASRKQDPAAHLGPSVMKEILSKNQSSPRQSPKSKYPAWLITSTCLFAGIGKIGLIFHLAY